MTAVAPSRRAATEVAFFAALGTLAVVQWSRLLAEPPTARLLAALAIVTAAAAALAFAAARGRVRTPLAAATILVATGAAMVAIGLPARLLAPGAWGELAGGLDRGVAAVQEAELPYDGGDQWPRLALLLLIPVLLGLAALAGFWPGRHRGALRLIALAILVGLYGTAVTLDSPPGELLWGVVLALLVAGWLWAPTLGIGIGIALALTAAAAIVALPVAAALDPARAWWSYRDWRLLGSDPAVGFDWDHAYGPLPWPDSGTTLLDVHSTRPAYWKASVLDRFDGFTWKRARSDDLLGTAERAARRTTAGAELAERHPEWRMQASIEVLGLSSRVLVSPGAAQAIEGVEATGLSADGTARADGDGLGAGDRYSVVSYVPQPSAQQLREAPRTYPQKRFGHSTLVALPARVGPEGEFGLAPDRARAMPLWGTRPDRRLRRDLLASPYGPTYRLARALVADAANPYEATVAIQRHLREGYDYSPNVTHHTYPLPAFLFEDGSGYCQHFAGSMGLMLRMVGIPSRVVSGFAPGRLDEQRDVYEIRDTDAHSWVEVYFRGIGWVVFDPTPAAAPAASQGSTASAATFFRGRGSVADEEGGRERGLEPSAQGGVAPAPDGGGPWAAIAAALAAALAALAICLGVVVRRRRLALASGARGDAQLAELRRAIGWLAGAAPAGVTLLDLERRFRTRPAIARYAATLRAHRFAPGSPPPPGPGARRSLRRALAGGGLRGRWRALRAIPPGGPR